MKKRFTKTSLKVVIIGIILIILGGIEIADKSSTWFYIGIPFAEHLMFGSGILLLLLGSTGMMEKK